MVYVHGYILAVLSVVQTQVSGKLNPTFINNGQADLVNSTVFLARQFFTKSSSTLVVLENTLESLEKIQINQVYEQILLNLQGCVAVQLFVGSGDKQPWENHIVVVNSAKAFDNIRWAFPTTSFERDFRFLVVLADISSDFLLEIELIFNCCYKMNVINVNIIVNHPSLGVCLYQYNIFSERGCRLLQPFLYAQNGVKDLKTLFPEKLKNFHGCPLTISARENQPMLVFVGNTSDPRPDGFWDNLSGVDGEIIKTVARHLNFTIKLLPFDDVVPSSGRYRCFENVENGKADMAIGGLSNSDSIRFLLTPSIVYQFTPIVFVIPGGFELNCINRLKGPFAPGVWMLVALILLSGVIIIRGLKSAGPKTRILFFGESNNAPMTNFFASFLGYPTNPLPRKYFPRFLLLLWLLVTLILRSAYQGSLYDAIRRNRFSRTPRNFDDLERMNYRILVSNHYKNVEMFSSTNLTLFVEHEHERRFQIVESTNEKYATVAFQDNFINYMEKNFRNGSRLKALRSPLYLHQGAFFFPKHSLFVPAINKNLKMLIYAGITRHLAQSNVKDIKLFDYRKRKNPRKPLSNERIWSAYKILGNLILMNLIVFILEILSVYSKHLRDLIEWIN